MTTATSPLDMLRVDGDYVVTAWLDVDGLPGELLRLVVEMRRRGETWSMAVRPFSDGDELGLDGVGPALVALDGQTGVDPLALAGSGHG